jgi:hypothetical protein
MQFNISTSFFIRVDQLIGFLGVRLGRGLDMDARIFLDSEMSTVTPSISRSASSASVFWRFS